MGKIFALIGPSGAGKSTIASAIGLVPIVSMTTRQPRAGEQHGYDYYFVTKGEYLRALERGEFVEHVVNYGNFYGIPRSEIYAPLDPFAPRYMVVTYEGLQTLKHVCPDVPIYSLFIYATYEDVSERLRARVSSGALTQGSFEERMRSYPREVATAKYCDFIVPSLEGCLAQAINTANLIVESCN